MVECQGFGVHPGIGLEVGNLKGFAVAFEAVAEDIEHSSTFEFFGEAGN